MGLVKNFLPDADSLKTFWHLGCQDAALFPPLHAEMLSDVDDGSKAESSPVTFNNIEEEGDHAEILSDVDD